MKRRNFLKRIGQTIAGLAVAPSVVKAKKKQPEVGEGFPLKIFNGQVFEAPYPLCHTVIVMYFGRGDQWVLLSDPYPAAQHQGSAMIPCYYLRNDGSDNPFYTQAELQEKLKDWKLIQSHITLLSNMWVEMEYDK